MYQTIRPLIFTMTPEQAHQTTLRLLGLADWFPPVNALVCAIFKAKIKGPEVKCMGIRFPNPLGLAAGYDSNGLGWKGLAALGFGHIEIGTVTPKAQSGYPQPRVFRLAEDKAVINRMGFPNNGAEFLANKIKYARGKGVIIGVNIGKNIITSNEEAAEEYLHLARKFFSLADYLAINISSPNTPGLRYLQARNILEELLGPLGAEITSAEYATGRKVPIVVKLSLDLADDELEGALEAIIKTGMDGVIISNTTVRRPHLHSHYANEIGGLSGKPIKSSNTELVRKVVKLTGGDLPVIASGGVMAPRDAQEKIDAGASLIQLYTGLIYYGPALVKDILNSGLRYK
ncbi:MAG: quinone-dependent dihydroorotate dehydrogenase [Leptolinea sp.]